MNFTNPSDEEIFGYLRKAKRIAVGGLSNNPERTSYLVAKELQKAGYEIVPVNPILAGQEILGEKVFSSLTQITEHVDIVDIFRRSEFLPELAKEFLQIDADVFWAQKGIMNEEALAILSAASCEKIVMDRCTKVELMRLGGR